MYEPFEAEAWDNVKYRGAASVEVVAHDSGTKNGITMELRVGDYYVYLSKEQAMKFFGLVEPVKTTAQVQGFIAPYDAEELYEPSFMRNDSE